MNGLRNDRRHDQYRGDGDQRRDPSVMPRCATCDSFAEMRGRIVAAAIAMAGCDGEDSCFAGGTMISTPSGRRPIRDLAVGDSVWSYDPRERRFALGVVSHVHRARREVRSVLTASETIQAVTSAHPLYVASRRTFAADARLGETMLEWDDDPAKQPAESSIVGFASPAPGDAVEVFNLTVAGAFSTYFADGFLVHNKTVPPSCEYWDTLVSVSTVHTKLCTGQSSALRVTNEPALFNCSTPEELARRVVFATSDPSVLIVEGTDAIAVGPGVGTITLLLGGKRRGQVSIVVRDCTDAGTVTDAADADADDASNAADPADASDTFASD